MTEIKSTDPLPDRKKAILKLLKRVGVWGFLFFLVKGLIWLALGYWVFK